MKAAAPVAVDLGSEQAADNGAPAAGAEPYDIVILGGGLAGLSLAWRLADGPLRVAVVEPRELYADDRTWCYWNLGPHPFEHLVDRRWHRWRVAGPWGEIEGSSRRQPYERVPAAAFYGTALERLVDSPNVDLLRGVRAESLAEGRDQVRVTTSAGELSASLVFDSRPPAPRSGALEQRFLGWQIRSEDPCFDPRAATLMDFQETEGVAGVHFVYVLPDSLFEALVEDTWILPASGGAAERDLPRHEDHLRRYLERKYGDVEFEIRRRESGVIPMDPALGRRSQRGRVLPLGTRGGAVRPSTGYAFLNIQRQCDRALAAVCRSAFGRIRRGPLRRAPLRKIALGPETGAFDRWLDSLFLAYLRRHPERAPQLFRSLFEHTPEDALSRFLGGRGSLWDRLAAMRALPKKPMIGQAFRWVANHG